MGRNNLVLSLDMDKGSRKKGIFFHGPATRRGGGNCLATKIKCLFLKLEKKNQKMLREGGGKALVANKKIPFFAASLIYNSLFCYVLRRF